MGSLHRGLLVMPKMYLKAKQSLYLLGDKSCRNCIPGYVVARSQKEVPAIPIVVQFRPWHKIGIVLFICKVKYYNISE